MRKKGILP